MLSNCLIFLGISKSHSAVLGIQWDILIVSVYWAPAVDQITLVDTENIMLPEVDWVPSFWGLHSGDEHRHCTLGLGKCGAHWSLRSRVPLMTSRKKRCLSRDKMMSRDPSSKRKEGEEAESKVLCKWEYTAQDKKCANYGRSKNLSGRVKFSFLQYFYSFSIKYTL